MTPGPTSPPGNVPGPVTLAELLADTRLVPGLRGADLIAPVGGVRFADISLLTIAHGVEFLLRRETETSPGGAVVRAAYRVYSGIPDLIPPPVFYRLGPGGSVTVERVVGHSHPRPVPFQPGWDQPSAEDVQYLWQVRTDWQRVYGPYAEPFGRIFGDPGRPAVIYGPRSVPGRAVPP